MREAWHQALMRILLVLADDIPVPRGDVSPEEMKASLQTALAEARDNEAAFIADLKKTKAPISAEDRQMVRAK